VRYEACPGSITSIAPDRSRKSVYRDPNCGRLCRTQSDWGLVAPAPDGRTLLAEEGIFTCGEEFATYFIPAAGGTRRPVVPLADFGSAEGIGWVNRNQALIATDGFADCDPNRSAIYLVDRRAPQAPTLIVDANGHDATLWGRS